MALEYPWMFFVAAGLLVIAIVVGVALGMSRKSKSAPEQGAPLARAERLRNLPSFARAIRQRRIALAATLIIGVTALGIGGFAAGRAMAEQTIQPVNTSRDVMLCLDVSGSMSEVDVEILDTFIELIDGFKGERIGLTIFNASPVQVFPLTDDYPYIEERLTNLRDAIEGQMWDPEFIAGTENGAGSSLIGDGLTACAMRFDHEEEERSRSIIFASDNELLGQSIVSLPDAAAYAGSKGIRVFAINPVAGANVPITEEMRQAAEATGGEMYELRGDTTVSDIVTSVQEEDATELKGELQIIQTDAPQVWLLLLTVLSVSFILVLWRVRL